MLSATYALLQAARDGGYAVGAFNVYNLEGVRAVVAVAETVGSPVILQVHPAALGHGGRPLLALCLAAAREARAPVAVHLDHCPNEAGIRTALAAGLSSVMADGSHLPYDDNVTFSRRMVALAHSRGATVEAELGRLAGTEDGLTVEAYEARLTDPAQAVDFVGQTGVDALAVCIGNVHGAYRSAPRLDFERLAAIRQAVGVPLVLHGASGLPAGMIGEAIALGVCKINVNTELRHAFLSALTAGLADADPPDLLRLLQGAGRAMEEVVAAKLRLFGSIGQSFGKVKRWPRR